MKGRRHAALLGLTLGAVVAVTGCGSSKSSALILAPSGQVSLCLPGTPQLREATVGAAYLTNSASSSLQITALSPVVGSANVQLVDSVIVPLTGEDAIGTGAGLPTAPADTAAGLIPKDWAQRRYVPGAEMPPEKSTPQVKYWQLAIGVRKKTTTAAARLNELTVTYRVGDKSGSVRVPLVVVLDTAGKAC